MTDNICETCIWKDQCGQDCESCPYYEAAREDFEEELSVEEYFADLHEREDIYKEMVEEQNN